MALVTYLFHQSDQAPIVPLLTVDQLGLRTISALVLRGSGILELEVLEQ